MPLKEKKIVAESKANYEKKNEKKEVLIEVESGPKLKENLQKVSLEVERVPKLEEKPKEVSQNERQWSSIPIRKKENKIQPKEPTDSLAKDSGKPKEKGSFESRIANERGKVTQRGK